MSEDTRNHYDYSQLPERPKDVGAFQEGGSVADKAYRMKKEGASIYVRLMFDLKGLRFYFGAQIVETHNQCYGYLMVNRKDVHRTDRKQVLAWLRQECVGIMESFKSKKDRACYPPMKLTWAEMCEHRAMHICVIDQLEYDIALTKIGLSRYYIETRGFPEEKVTAAQQKQKIKDRDEKDLLNMLGA